MRKLNRLMPLFVVLVIGGALLFRLATPAPEPVASPTVTPIPPAATNIVPGPPTLPDNCAALGGTYRLRYSTPNSAPASDARIASPMRQNSVFRQNGQVFFQAGQESPVRLGNEPVDRSLRDVVYWSPDGRRLAYVRANGADLVVAGGGLPPRTLTRLAYPQAFIGWSPDGGYVVVYRDFPTSINIIAVDSGKITYSTSSIYLVGQAWSPDGQWLAYLWRDDDFARRMGVSQDAVQVSRHILSLVRPDGSDEVRFPLLKKSDVWGAEFVWSPDSRHVAVRYRANLEGIGEWGVFFVGAYGVDGSHFPAPDFKIDDPKEQKLPFLWSASGDLFSFTEQTGAPDGTIRYTLMAYQPSANALKPLAQEMDRGPFYSPDGSRVAYYTMAGGRKSITISDLDGANPVKLADAADDSGNADWSPDGKWVAAVWATGEVDDPARRVRLSWMHPNGTERHDLEADFKDVHDLRWMKDGRLAYVAWRGAAGNSIEVVDTASSERHVIAGGLQEVVDFTYNADVNQLSFWYEDEGGSLGKTVYTADGALAYRFTISDGLDRPRKEFWSPDGKVAAVKIGRNWSQSSSGEALALVYTDGRPPLVLRDNLYGLGDPLWSPDGKLLAYTWADRQFRPATMDVVTTGGKTLWTYAPYTLWQPSEWERCDK
jgi:Tol biopolymer transport system component